MTDDYEANKLVYTEEQNLFITDALSQGFEVYYTYSGRNMYGATCPAVDCDYVGEIKTEANTQHDDMGLGVVIYCMA